MWTFWEFPFEQSGRGFRGSLFDCDPPKYTGVSTLKWTRQHLFKSGQAWKIPQWQLKIATFHLEHPLEVRLKSVIYTPKQNNEYSQLLHMEVLTNFLGSMAIGHFIYMDFISTLHFAWENFKRYIWNNKFKLTCFQSDLLIILSLSVHKPGLDINSCVCPCSLAPWLCSWPPEWCWCSVDELTFPAKSTWNIHRILKVAQQRPSTKRA